MATLLRAERLSLCRYHGLDILKAICAFLIVCIHCPFPGEFGQYFVSLARIAVPIFFMITGFFYAGAENRNAFGGRQIKKIAVLLIESNFLFCVWKMILALISDGWGGVLTYLQETITVKSILKFIVLNESPFNGHLWYLGAILYVLVIFIVTDRLHIRKLLYIVTPVLLIGDLIFGKYSMVIFGREFPYVIVRNFLFVGIPYFSIGCLIKHYESNLKKHLKISALIGMSIVFMLTTLLERYILVSADLNPTRDHYISSTFLAVTVFMIALKETNIFGCGGRMIGILKCIGKNYSTWIYIIHPIFITILGAVMKRIGAYSIYQYGASIMVYLTTTLFLACVFECRKKFALGTVRK